jgi:hypothetical protein
MESDVAVTLSANVNDLAAITRRMAEEENRTVSNVVENALLVFSDFPKPLRDSLLALHRGNAGMYQDMTREMMAYIARAKFDAAMAEIAPYFGQEGDAERADIDLLEQSTTMTRRRR